MSSHSLASSCECRQSSCGFSDAKVGACTGQSRVAFVHNAHNKHCAIAPTRSLALEWGPEQIRVVGIAPGPIADTPGTTKLAPGLTQSEMDGMIAEGIPLGRMGQAWEIGHAAVYLCTARYVTGDVLIVDGGQWLHKPPMVPGETVEQLSRQVEAKSRAQAPKFNSKL